MSEILKIGADHISPLRNIDLVAGRSKIQKSFRWETIHRSDWNLILISSGSGAAKINGETIPMNAGALYLFAPSDSPRQLFSAGWVTYWAHFQLWSSPEWPQKSPGVFELNPPPHEFRRYMRDLAEVFRLALGLHRGWHPLAVRLLETVILRGNMLSASEQTDRRLQKAEKILSDVTYSGSIDDVAALSGMSRSVFYNLFRETYGVSPRIFRERTQINSANILLDSTKLPLREICHRVGMNDLPQFCKRYKLFCGMTPTQYRRQTNSHNQGEEVPSLPERSDGENQE